MGKQGAALLGFVAALTVWVMYDALASRAADLVADAISQRNASARVAVCLVGQARHFDLTGPTIREHLLDRYEGADLFLNVPLDKDSWKLALLGETSSSVKLAMARIFRPLEIDQSSQDLELLNPGGSPKGAQGLLQYFRLVEGCSSMISSYEQLSNITYDWIIRARLDSFWSGPIPTEFKPGVYTVPDGVRFGGFNDRLGVGQRDMSMVALRRLSILPFLHARGHRNQGSEKLFKSHLRLSRVGVSEESFPFCILSDRRFPWPPKRGDVPVMSITSKGPLNGAYCRPCTPQASGGKAKEMVSRLGRNSGWIPTDGEVDVELCDARAEWEAGWKWIFDEILGERAARTWTEPGNTSVADFATGDLRNCIEYRLFGQVNEPNELGLLCCIENVPNVLGTIEQFNLEEADERDRGCSISRVAGKLARFTKVIVSNSA